MKLSFTFLSLLFIIFGCTDEYVSANGNSNDTIFLKRELKDTPYHFYNAIYIDTAYRFNAKNSIADFSFEHFDSVTYFRELESLQPLKKIRGLPNSFPRKWILLYQYKNEYYTYDPSEQGENYKFEITDSCTIDYSMEGPEPSRINKITQLTPTQILIHTSNLWQRSTLNIHIIDPDKGITIFTFGLTKDIREELKFLMVSVDKAHKFKTIVNYCKTDKVGEFDFDEINFKKLEQQKNREITNRIRYLYAIVPHTSSLL